MEINPDTRRTSRSGDRSDLGSVILSTPFSRSTLRRGAHDTTGEGPAIGGPNVNPTGLAAPDRPAGLTQLRSRSWGWTTTVSPPHPTAPATRCPPTSGR